jgi:hypothetical protein
MQQFFNNKYVQLAGLTIGIGLLFFVILWLAASLFGMNEFPIALEALLALLAAGAVVYKFFSQRIF